MARKKKGIFDDLTSWLGMKTSSARVVRCFDKVLGELSQKPLLALSDLRLRIAVIPFSFNADPVSAVFGADGQKYYEELFEPDSETEILLVVFEPDVDRLLFEFTVRRLRHHMGHVLRYLEDPELENDCSDAEREWQKSRR